LPQNLDPGNAPGAWIHSRKTSDRKECGSPRFPKDWQASAVAFLNKNALADTVDVREDRTSRAAWMASGQSQYCHWPVAMT
jgi:hypothetical protein